MVEVKLINGCDEVGYIKIEEEYDGRILFASPKGRNKGVWYDIRYINCDNIIPVFDKVMVVSKEFS